MKKRIAAWSLGFLVGAFVVWPSKIEPAAYDPEPSVGFTGSFAFNDRLKVSEVYALADGHGPEDVAVDADGRLYGGLQDGRIIRLSADGAEQETFAIIEGGRPLGLHFDEGGNLIVADAWKGLLSFTPDGSMTVLATEHGGVPFAFTNDIDIASDGRIYFSDASYKYHQPDYRLDLLEARGNGRLLRYDPASGQTELLLNGLFFGNGVALSQNEDFVLVNETGRYRIQRYWLKGEKAGQSDVFVNGLPGFPDGLSSGRDGIFWLALPSPRNPLMDKLHPHPWAKKLVSKLPKFMQPSAIKQGSIVAINEAGEIVASLHDPEGEHVHMVTSVQKEGAFLYMGSLEAPQIAKIAYPEGLR